MNELQNLRDRVAELEELIGLNLIPEILTLGPIQRKVLGLLRKRGLVTPDLFYRAVYGERDEPKALYYLNSVVHRLRKALKPYGIAIRTDRGRGYFLDASGKATIDRLMADLCRSVQYSDCRVRDLANAHRFPHLWPIADNYSSPVCMAPNDLEA